MKLEQLGPYIVAHLEAGNRSREARADLDRALDALAAVEALDAAAEAEYIRLQDVANAADEALDAARADLQRALDALIAAGDLDGETC